MAEDRRSRSRGFRHEALLYRSRAEFVEVVADFVADGLVRGEPAVIAVSADKLEVLRSALGGHQQGVFFVDMDVVGRNPACLIPAYHDFISANAPDGPSRGVGEPIGPHRSGAELIECEIHEWLCNVAFAQTKWWVVCPYDTSVLDPSVVDEAHRNHPLVVEGGKRRPSPTYEATAGFDGLPGESLPEPDHRSPRLRLTEDRLSDVRSFVSHHARAIGLDSDRTDDLAHAVDGIVTGSGEATAGDGGLSVWQEGSTVVVDLRDRRRITDPLIGREPPGIDGGPEGRALRAANRLCDLVQVRSDQAGTTVRLRQRMASASASAARPETRSFL